MSTALIAAEHLGHIEMVRRLIEMETSLDQINNLHLTASVEAVVLGDGGPNHARTARHRLESSVDKTKTDNDRIAPYEHAVSSD